MTKTNQRLSFSLVSIGMRLYNLTFKGFYVIICLSIKSSSIVVSHYMSNSSDYSLIDWSTRKQLSNNLITWSFTVSKIIL